MIFKDHSMSARLETRLPIRFYNGIASVFEKNFNSQFEPEQLLEKAARKNLLSDFGEDGFQEGFRILCDSLNKDARLHPMGKFLAQTTIFAILRNRLELSARWKEHPEVLNKKIIKPVIIVGLPRTGTTLLFNLLALDDRFQYLRAWEAVRPGLSVNTKRSVSKAIAEKNADVNFYAYLRPELKKIHYITSQMPEECIPLLNNSFECNFFQLHFKVTRYSDWFCRHDHRRCYHYYRDQLKWLQRKKNGRRWLLKSPFHLFAVSALYEIFPDALVLQTHRDPVAVIPSMSSLMYTYQSMTTYDVDRKDIGMDVIELFSKPLQDMLTLREHDNLNILDIRYEDLVLNPIKVLEAIYRHMGESLNVAMKVAVENYVTKNPKDKYGRHDYCYDDYGVTQEIIRSKFDFYYQHFNFAEKSSFGGSHA